jgi:TPP-dependent pyruvate/acetoin dehydrogenase alpha subunit
MVQPGTRPLDLADAERPPKSEWERGDPILNESRRLLRLGVEMRALLALDTAVREEVERAFAAAARAPLSPASVALTDVWANSPSPLAGEGSGGG